MKPKTIDANTRHRRIENALREATMYKYSAFHCGDPVNGAELVQWFAEWRQRALKALRE